MGEGRHVVRIGEMIGVYRVLLGNLREGDRLGYPDLDGRMILIWICRKWDLGVWSGSSWFRKGQDGGHV
jgi:hypothetical protein